MSAPVLLRLLDLVGTSPNLRCDLRTRDVQGGLIYSHEDECADVGTLERVWIRDKRDARRSQRWLCWTFRRDLPRRQRSTVSDYSALLIEENGRNVVTELSHDPYLLALEAPGSSWVAIR
jgi:hypothetical protein